MSNGNYAQDFNSLATGGTSNPWTDNSTLPGWYASRTSGGPAVTTYRAESGTSTAGALCSFGSTASSERALGSVASGTPGNFAYGVRFTNDTAITQTSIFISFTGEQWRNGGIAAQQTLAFSYRVSSSAITDSDAANANSWISFADLNFSAPMVSATAGALDGNAATNQQEFINVALAGVNVAPGQELFLRWLDVDDAGFDHGLALDDLIVRFNSDSNAPPAAPIITTQPRSQTVAVGANVTFVVAATGNPPPAYQWQFSGTNLTGETNVSLTLSAVTTNQAGAYTVALTNAAGDTTSQPASLAVFPPVPGFSLLTYNTHGNFISDWTTNSPQVQAIGRQVQYLDPDIITFQEIPLTNSGWTHMPEFVTAFRPGYHLATNSGSDGFIRSVILSRYPIARSASWLDAASLTNFGYNGRFTRDLFEAQIAVPGFPQPLHVFTTHLKSGQGTDDSARRAAEASAISNFLAHGFLTTNGLHPYVLTGDMNEDIARPPGSHPQSLERLTSVPTGLQLATPENPFTGNEMTFSIRDGGGLSKRYDYILPNPLLFGSRAGGQVFRTDWLPNPPPPLLASDSVTASDHLPVLMTFNNPYAQPFHLVSLTRSNQTVTLKWETVAGQPYRVEDSTNLTKWNALASHLVATSNSCIFATNLTDIGRYFRILREP
ncbi:MAG: immunoglobulin domain-containing protein [Verrucomicrobia bacterium]|nr:immunoglobulin domain-containing protein [Verrucomicrobiota bacterium]